MEQQNPVQPEVLTPTPAAEWAGAIQVEGSDVKLPSGNVARVRQISPQTLLASGMIPNPLMGIISQAINSHQGMPPKAMEKLAEDPKKMVEALLLFDRVLAHCMVMPEVKMPPPCRECEQYANVPKHDPEVRGNHKYNEAPRESGILYADVVDMHDKMFVFQWAVGGVRDLESFREGLAAGMGDVPDGEDVVLPPE